MITFNYRVQTWFENACAAAMTKFKITKRLKPYKKFIIVLIPPSPSFYIIPYFSSLFFLILRLTGALAEKSEWSSFHSFSFKNIRSNTRYHTLSSLWSHKLSRALTTPKAFSNHFSAVISDTSVRTKIKSDLNQP